MNRNQLLEADIISRLTAALTIGGQRHPKVDVQAWPDNPTAFRMAHPIGTVLVVYKGTKYAKTTADTDQSDYEVSIMARTLREPNPTDSTTDALGVGTYDLIDTVVGCLHGWSPAEAMGQLLVTSDGFDKYNEGVWFYTIRCAVPMFPRIGVASAVGPWTDATCLDAPPFVHADYQFSATPTQPNEEQP